MHGLIAGRFLPPHAGHQWLAESARGLVDRLTVLVLTRSDDAIAGAVRLGWLREMLPWAEVVGARGDDPAALRAACPHGVDLMFGADAEDAATADAFGARLVPLDPPRLAMPVSGRAIRADPLAHWRFLPAPVRPAYARTICLHGPESTGKSTLAPRLAAHFDTLFVPEYGRTYCEQYGTDLVMDDLVTIGRTYAAMTAAALRRCNRRLILDTDPLMTAAWADMLFGRRDPWFDAFDATADLYLLLDIDLPWVDDGTRFFGDDVRRRRFLDLSRAELDRRGLPHAVIGGPRDERLERALAAIAAAGLG